MKYIPVDDFIDFVRDKIQRKDIDEFLANYGVCHRSKNNEHHYPTADWKGGSIHGVKLTKIETCCYCGYKKETVT